jgi:UDP-N-acetylglucosamine 1-carboxyvinyltransferase
LDKLIICGGKKLKGVVDISGAKNAALPIMAASLLSSGYCIINRVPDLGDVMTMGRLLANLGAGFHYEDGKVLCLHDLAGQRYLFQEVVLLAQGQ